MRLSEEKTREKTKIKRTQVQETTMRLSLKDTVTFTLIHTGKAHVSRDLWSTILNHSMIMPGSLGNSFKIKIETQSKKNNILAGMLSIALA